MRKLTLREIRLPAGGHPEEFRTLMRHEIPRWKEPPNRWILVPERQQETGMEDSSKPVPSHWLPPCSDEWPEVL